jgi:hypothetical protein
MTSNVSAALGPTLGGVLLLAFPWQALFLINVPLVILGLVLALLLLPKDQSGHTTNQRCTHLQGTSLSLVVRALDLPGVALFSGALTCLLIFLLALGGDPPGCSCLSSCFFSCSYSSGRSGHARPFST